jgi:hypothetical protein
MSITALKIDGFAAGIEDGNSLPRLLTSRTPESLKTFGGVPV